MPFTNAGQNAEAETVARLQRGLNRLRFGVSYLDDAFRGLLQSDLVLFGAYSGSGKTQFCCNLALTNLALGKRVHFIALEAEEYEIEARLKFQLISQAFFADPKRPRIRLDHFAWINGEYGADLEKYELAANETFREQFKNLWVFYKIDKFDVSDLVRTVQYAASDTDLVIVDHVHYFDFEDDNENRAIKQIAKTARTLALENKKPIVLVSHLRKRDRHNEELAPGLDEFHGSSDLYKIATKVVTIAPGKITEAGNFETFLRIAKSRIDGSVTRYLGRTYFNPQKGAYEEHYRVGWADQKRNREFEEVDSSRFPGWARRFESPSGSDPDDDDQRAKVRRIMLGRP